MAKHGQIYISSEPSYDRCYVISLVQSKGPDSLLSITSKQLTEVDLRPSLSLNRYFYCLNVQLLVFLLQPSRRITVLAFCFCPWGYFLLADKAKSSFLTAEVCNIQYYGITGTFHWECRMRYGIHTWWRRLAFDLHRRSKVWTEASRLST